MQIDFSNRLNQLEQRSRNRNLEIVGLKKPSPSESDSGMTIQFLNDVVKANINSDEIDVLHEVPSKRRDKKRIIIANFKWRSRRDEILELCKGTLRAYNEALDPEERVYINEQLSPDNKRLLSMGVRQRHELGYKFAWSKGGNIFMRKDDQSPVHKIIWDADFEKVL